MSQAIRIVVMGVRNSWETSETNCCCSVDSLSNSPIRRSNWAAMSFIDLARAARSSVPRTAMRSSNAPSANFEAVMEACRMGWDR